MPSKILIVLSPFSDSKTLLSYNSLYVKALSSFYQQMNGARFECDFLSLNGTSPQNVPSKVPPLNKASYKLLHDPAFLNRLKYSLHPDRVDVGKYQALFFCGGLPILSALEKHTGLQKITTQIYETGGYIATLGHGIAGLLDVRLSDNSYLLSDKRITAASREEDRLLGFSPRADFIVENKLRDQGANFEKSKLPFIPHVIRDQQLITGQNYLSASLLCKELAEALADTGLELTTRMKKSQVAKPQKPHDAVIAKQEKTVRPQPTKVALT